MFVSLSIVIEKVRRCQPVLYAFELILNIPPTPCLLLDSEIRT